MRILKGTILLVFVCVFIRIAVGKPCVVPSGSMEPTLLCGDRLWINKLAYGGRLPKRWADIPLLNVFTWIRPLRIADEQNHWKYFRLPGFTQPQLGDIVVFNSPMDERVWLVKRITHIIPQGDTLAINKETLNSYRSLIIREGSSIAKYRNRIFINGKCDSLYITKHTFYFMEVIIGIIRTIAVTSVIFRKMQSSESSIECCIPLIRINAVGNRFVGRGYLRSYKRICESSLA